MDLQENGVSLFATWAGSQQSTYALSLMDIILTDKEMANCCYETSKRSAKPWLLQSKVQFLKDTCCWVHNAKIPSIIAECVKRKFGSSSKENNSLRPHKLTNWFLVPACAFFKQVGPCFFCSRPHALCTCADGLISLWPVCSSLEDLIVSYWSLAS